MPVYAGKLAQAFDRPLNDDERERLLGNEAYARSKQRQADNQATAAGAAMFMMLLRGNGAGGGEELKLIGRALISRINSSGTPTATNAGQITDMLLT